MKNFEEFLNESFTKYSARSLNLTTFEEVKEILIKKYKNVIEHNNKNARSLLNKLKKKPVKFITEEDQAKELSKWKGMEEALTNEFSIPDTTSLVGILFKQKAESIEWMGMRVLYPDVFDDYGYKKGLGRTLWLENSPCGFESMIARGKGLLVEADSDSYQRVAFVRAHDLLTRVENAEIGKGMFSFDTNLNMLRKALKVDMNMTYDDIVKKFRGSIKMNKYDI